MQWHFGKLIPVEHWWRAVDLGGSERTCAKHVTCHVEDECPFTSARLSSERVPERAETLLAIDHEVLISGLGRWRVGSEWSAGLGTVRRVLPKQNRADGIAPVDAIEQSDPIRLIPEKRSLEARDAETTFRR